MFDTPEMNIATVLFERNRWTPHKQPSFKVSEWAARYADAGFNGIELWENHLLLAEAGEQEALKSAPIPVNILNTYCTFDDAGASGRKASAALAAGLGVRGIKFNLGGDPLLTEQYMVNLSAWQNELPADCRLLCECHAGTVLEDPARATEILGPLQGQVEIIVHAFGGDDDALLKGWLDLFGPLLTHAHAAGTFTPDHGFLPLRDLEGLVRHRVGILSNGGFSGSWTLEFTAGVAGPREDMDQLMSAAADDLLFLREVLSC